MTNTVLIKPIYFGEAGITFPLIFFLTRDSPKINTKIW